MSKRTFSKTGFRPTGHDSLHQVPYDRSVTWKPNPPTHYAEGAERPNTYAQGELHPITKTSSLLTQSHSPVTAPVASSLSSSSSYAPGFNSKHEARYVLQDYSNGNGNSGGDPHHIGHRKMFIKSCQRRFVCTRWALVLLLNVMAIGITTAYVVQATNRGNQGVDGAVVMKQSSQNSNDEGGDGIPITEIQTVVQTSQSDKEQPEDYNQMKTSGKVAIEEPSALRNRLDWGSQPLPKFCREILKYPQPHRKNCSSAVPIPGTPKCNPDSAMMFSQYGEDYFLFSRHFQKTMKGPGLYLDIATNDAISISNTYFMDRCLGWKGICVEGNSKYYERIHRERSCALVPTCVGAKDGESVEFAISGPGSGIVSTHRQGEERIKKAANRVERKKCVTAMTELNRFGAHTIDYLNLDIEGGELTVLKSIDWDDVVIKIMSIEIAPSTEVEIDEFLTSRGFNKIDNDQPVGDMPGMPIYPSNRFYAHKSVTFGVTH